VLARIAYRPIPRRKPTLAETFTACYSGIFAFGALVDGKLKDARRQELDRAMEKALSELAALQEERQGLEESKGRDYVSRNERTRAVRISEDDVTVQEKPSYHPSSMYGALYAMIGDAGRLFERAPMDDPYRHIHELGLGVSLPHLTRHGLRRRARTDYAALEDAVANTRDERTNPHFAQRKARSRNEVTKAEDAVAAIVDQILHQVAFGGYKNNGCPELTSAHMPRALRAVWDARAEGYPWYWWRHTNNRDLTRQLIQASYSARGHAHQEYVAQVCYTLLALRGEVEVDKLNAIVLCMDRLGLHQVSKVVIGRFFHQMHARPSQHSVVSFLNHYKVTDSPLGFYSLFRHIVGDCDEGFKVFRRKLSDFRNAPWWHVKRWHIRYSLTLHNDTVVGRVTLTRHIASAILEGLLHFEMIDHAVEFFLATLDDGRVVSPWLLGLLVDHCLASLNWAAAVRLAQGLAMYPLEVTKMLVKSPDKEGLVVQLSRLFDMCGIVSAVPPAPLELDPWGLRHIQVAIWAKQLSIMSRRPLAVGYYGVEAPQDSGLRAVESVEWTPQAVNKLRMFGLGKQLEELERRLARMECEFVEGCARLRPRRVTVRDCALDLVQRQLDAGEAVSQEIAVEALDVGITTIANLVEVSERDLVPLQQRFITIRGISILGKIQKVEVQNIQLETELFRIHRTATQMRLRMVQLDALGLEEEVAAASWRLNAEQWQGFGGRRQRVQEDDVDGGYEERGLLGEVGSMWDELVT
jgi:hypothetical protein